MEAAQLTLTLHRLRRQPANLRCGTCDHEDKNGYKSVCVKFQIFVCADCKAAHAAYSHRCKSLTMSNWSEAEVNALRAGGNAKNAKTYFAKADRASLRHCPKPGEHPSKFKEWVVAAYEEKRYYTAAAETPGCKKVRFSSEAPEPPRVDRAVTMPAPTGDLLGDLLGPSPPLVTRAATEPTSTATFEADWGEFSSADAVAPAPPSAAPPPLAVPAEGARGDADAFAQMMTDAGASPIASPASPVTVAPAAPAAPAAATTGAASPFSLRAGASSFGARLTPALPASAPLIAVVPAPPATATSLLESALGAAHTALGRAPSLSRRESFEEFVSAPAPAAPPATLAAAKHILPAPMPAAAPESGIRGLPAGASMPPMARPQMRHGMVGGLGQMGGGGMAYPAGGCMGGAGLQSLNFGMPYMARA